MQTLISLVVFAVIVGTALGQTSTTVAPKVLMPKVTNETIGGQIMGQIFNGTSVNAGVLPWQAAIWITKPGGTYFCGGSLIDKNWVLTAGHCTFGATSFNIRLGTTSPTVGGVVILSSLSYTHVNYNPTTLNNDIGLIKLSVPAPLNANISVIKILPKNSSCGTTLRIFNISGWGKVFDNASTISPILMRANVNETDHFKCLTIYGSYVVVPTVVCATGKQNQSICSGDSGGALFLPAAGTSPVFQVGIVSFTAAVGCSLGFPQGFTRATMYLEWIQYMTNLTSL